MVKLRRCLWALDNVEGMVRLEAESVALAYLDPPFNSGRSYGTVLSKARNCRKRRCSIHLLTLGVGRTTLTALSRISVSSFRNPAVEFVQSITNTLGFSSASAAYLVEMAPRLAESHRVLRRDGSLYVHCDPTASHHLKLLLDHIFGPDNFRNQIIWKRTHAHSSSRRYGPVHDTLLFYSKSSEYTWNPVFAQYQGFILGETFPSNRRTW